MHSRNRHTGRYDLPRLTECWPALAPFVAPNEHGDLSVDFADPAAVKALNRALLAHDYGITHWDIPEGYLCPPIPGRADYLHHLADLLASENGGEIPRGPSVRGLDVGVGANCIYPIIGQGEYGWSFVGTDVDPVALAAAQATVDANPALRASVELRRQERPGGILAGVLRADETFRFTVCNPPFHASLEEARAGSRRKWRNLGHAAKAAGKSAPARNFGGQGGELWCPGGEAAFVGRMIRESAELGERVGWFTALISKEANLPGIYRALQEVGAKDHRTIDMAQGQKKSRIVAWTFGGATLSRGDLTRPSGPAAARSSSPRTRRC